MKRYDCFTFFNEFELLELRLTELYDCVDSFVIAEANVTHQGKSKPLLFSERRAEFAKFESKIRYLVVNDMPQTSNSWDREFHQRNALVRAMNDLSPDDLVMISDVDEIPKREVWSRHQNETGISFLSLDNRAFFMNWRNSRAWIKSFLISGSTLQKVSKLNGLPNVSEIRRDPALFFRKRNLLLDDHIIPEAGWHFSWLGGTDRIKEKFSAFAHTEAWLQRWAETDLINNALDRKNFFDMAQLSPIEDIAQLPETVQSNVEKFREIGFLHNL